MEPSEQFLAKVEAGHNVLLTGPGGVGKTFLVNRLLEERPDIAKTASTGLAARHIGGVTLHKWAGTMRGPGPKDEFDAFHDGIFRQMPGVIFRARRNARHARTIVIDEISMIPGRFLDYVDYCLRRYRDTEIPFGGLQVIATGDFLQLPPVNKDGGAIDWAFRSRSWHEAGFEVVQLTKVHRQDNAQFIRLLHAIREGRRLDGAQVAMLGDRVRVFPPLKLTRLFPTKLVVDKWNEVLLEQVPGTTVTLPAKTWGEEKKVETFAKDILAPRELKLKPGAYVLMVVNDRNDRFVNGSSGTVLEIDEREGVVTVQIGEHEMRIGRFTWSEDDRHEVTFAQFPMRLAYCLTVHKAQGMSLDSAYIDAGSACLTPAMTYVALSRVKSPDGLYLRAPFTSFSTATAALKFYGLTA